MNSFVKLILVLLPWCLKRRLLVSVYKYEISPTARIGLSWVFPKKLVMGEYASIGSFTVVKGLDCLSMEESSLVGRGNWISGYPSGPSRSFASEADRESSLYLESHSAITSRHIIDCTNRVSLGKFSTIAGFRSQVLTHSIDVQECLQKSSPVEVGAYCFIGTGCIILAGSKINDYVLVAGGSTVVGYLDVAFSLYGGSPAKRLKEVSRGAKYFMRSTGVVS